MSWDNNQIERQRTDGVSSATPNREELLALENERLRIAIAKLWCRKNGLTFVKLDQDEIHSECKGMEGTVDFDVVLSETR